MPICFADFCSQHFWDGNEAGVCTPSTMGCSVTGQGKGGPVCPLLALGSHLSWAFPFTFLPILSAVVYLSLSCKYSLGSMHVASTEQRLSVMCTQGKKTGCVCAVDCIVWGVLISGAVCLVHHCIAIARKLSLPMAEEGVCGPWPLRWVLLPARMDWKMLWLGALMSLWAGLLGTVVRGSVEGHVCFTSHAVTVALSQGHFGCPLGLPASDMENIMNTFLVGKKLS